ncbi:MAG: cysteine--tRNA ligase, partial [bacterium]|nr:cysteine--tRNA ligase [bacterium]
ADGIYFDTSKLKDYGKLARLQKTELAAGKRVAMKEKKNPTDFALWKFSPVPSLPREKRQQEWESPWGIGFPGWHIECSAMSMKYLGGHFDIHTGGIDHIPVHHTNEIAQSEAATGTKFVNFWLHNEFLTYKGEKVSKSTGGLYIISELEEQGFNPLAYRYLCLGGHYRKSLEFSLEALKNAQNSYERLKNIVRELKDDGKINKKYLADFEKAINNDLDTPKALATLWRLLRDRKAQGKVKTVAKMDEIFGLDLLKEEKIETPAEIIELAGQREKARAKKDWQRADELRQKITELGWLVKDSPQGSVINKKF